MRKTFSNFFLFLAVFYQGIMNAWVKNGQLGGYVHDTAMSQYIPPTAAHIVTGTWTQAAGQVAGTICMHKAAAAESPTITGNLIIRYTIPHTVSGLDGGTESTLAALWDAVLLDGACYYSCVIRAASRIEVVNLNSDVPDPWQSIAEHYQAAFQAGLILVTQQPSGRVPDKNWQPRSWNDNWHNFQIE
jgi:hypothetical protein